MAEHGDILHTLTAQAAGDLSGKQFHFLRWSAVNQVNQASQAVAQDFAGVLMNKPAAAGRAATVAALGEVKITAGGALTVNDLISTNSSGRAAAAASGHWVAGRVLETAGADGDVVRMLLIPHFTGIPT